MEETLTIEELLELIKQHNDEFIIHIEPAEEDENAGTRTF